MRKSVYLQGRVLYRPHLVGTVLAAMNAEDDKADSHEGEDNEKSLSIHNYAAKVSKISDGCSLFLLKFVLLFTFGGKYYVQELFDTVLAEYDYENNYSLKSSRYSSISPMNVMPPRTTSMIYVPERVVGSWMSPSMLT